MKMNKNLSRAFAIMISFIMVVSTLNISAYADDELVTQGVNKGITIEMTAVDAQGQAAGPNGTAETISMGESGYFRLKAENASVEQQTVNVRIKLPEVLFNQDEYYLKDFNKDSTTLSTSDNIQIELVKEGEEHYLQFAFSEGSIVQHSFPVAFTNGVTESGKRVEINASDIEVVTESSTTPVEKSGGTLVFAAGFDWENVSLSSAPNEVSVSKGALKEDISYTISNTSKNRDHSGAIFTKEYTVAETITLPEYVDFPEGTEVSVIKNADGSNSIKVGDTIVAVISGKGTFSILDDEEKKPTIDGKTLKFTIKCENSVDSEGEYTEVTNPEYKVTLKNLKTAESGTIRDYYKNGGAQLKITNDTVFTATPFFGEPVTSTANAETIISDPAEAWSVRKESNHPYIAPNETIQYRITITNESEFDLVKKGFTINDDLSEYLRYASGSAVISGYDENGNAFTEKISDEAFSNGKLDYSKEMLIPKGGKIVLTFDAIVSSTSSKGNGGLRDGYIIKNAAVVSADGISRSSNETEDKYTSGTPQRTIKKEAKMVDDKAVINGNFVLYTITLGNNSALPLPFTLTDILPQYIDADTITDVQIKYTKNGKIGKAESIGWKLSSDKTQIVFNTITLSKNANNKGWQAIITFKAKITGLNDSVSGTQIINKALVPEFSGSIAGRYTTMPAISDTAILTSEERGPKLSIQKTVGGSPSAVDSDKKIYSIPYKINAKNLGTDDPITQEDITAGKTTIVDIMQGGLMPEISPGETGTIQGQYVSGTLSKSIPGEYERVTAEDGKTNYIIKWKIDEIYYEKDGDLYQEGTISYNGYIDTTTTKFSDALNVAGLQGGRLSSTKYPTLKPTISKRIYSINGKRTSGNAEKSCEVRSGDKIVYEIKAANKGSYDAVKCVITDQLPGCIQINGSTYYNEDNVKISLFRDGKNEDSIGDFTFGYTNGTLIWRNVTIGANSELTIRVEIQYPKGKDFSKYFLQTGETEITKYNTVTLNYDEQECGKASVEHQMKRTVLNIQKSVNTNKVLQTGESAIFTLSGFGTQAGVYNYRVLDLLDDIARLGDLSELNTGAFDGISKYILTLTYDKKDENGEYKQKSVTYSGEQVQSNQTLSAKSLKLENDTSAKVISVEWNFEGGDYVPYLDILSNPTLKMTVPKGNTPGSGQNKATVYYDESSAEATAGMRAVNGNAIKKTAEVGSKKVQNDTNPIKSGDEVTFRIEYKNISNTIARIDGSHPITDRLATKGLSARDEYSLSATLFDAEGNKAETQGIIYANGERFLRLTQNDISSNTAKVITFTYLKEDGTAFEIPAEYTLKISYSVVASDDFANSQLDKNKGKASEDWETAGYGNTYMIHNEVSVEASGQTVKAETGWYYQKGANRLKMQKSVSGLGFLQINDPNRALADVYFQISKPSTDQEANAEKLNNLNKDLNIWEYEYGNWTCSSITGQRDARPNINVIKYTVAIENDINSAENLSIASIADALPSNWKTGCIGHYGGYHHNISSPVILWKGSNGSVVTWEGNRTSGTGVPQNKPTEGTVGVEINSDGTMRNGYVKWNNSKKQFTVTTSENSSSPLELKPGEYFAFSYFVVMNRRLPDPQKWSNTATLNIGQTNAEFEVNNAIRMKSNTASSVTAKRNDGDCIKKSATAFSSTVDIYSLGNRVGIKKSSAGVYSAAKYSGSFSAATTLSDITTIDEADKTAASSDKVYAAIDTASKKVSFNDIVEWQIQVTNQGSAQTTRITDELPYPYRAITDGSAVMQKYNTETEEWENVEGTIEEVGTAFGGVSQKITADLTLAAGSTTKLRVLARYTGEESGKYFSRNYRNNAKLEAIDADGNTLEISGVVEGTAQREGTKIMAVTTYDYVYPTIGAETSSVKAITNAAGKTARGDANLNAGELNYVTTPSAGDSAKYTLRVNNDSGSTLKNFVLIDKLPQIGDTGSLDTTTGRQSEFSVGLADVPGVRVLIGNKNSDETTDVTENVNVSYKTVEASDDFTATEWSGSGSGWISAPAAVDSGKTTAIRINLSGVEILKDQYISVVYNAKVGDDAQLGRIAWNSFGYAYTSALDENIRLYAEPAKVGIKISGKEIAIKKVWEDVVSASRPSLSDGLTIRVIGKNQDDEIKFDKTYTGAEITWTQGTDKNVWNAVISGLPIQIDEQPLTYSVEEISPTGYKQKGEIVDATDPDGLQQFVITNTQTKEISGLKIWNDGKTSHATPPQLKLSKFINNDWAVVDLEAEGVTLKWEDATLEEAKKTGFSAGTDGIKHVQKYTFENLAYEYIYRVEEDAPDGYKSDDNGKNFTNTLLTNISISKKWKDGNRADRPTSVSINLLADGVILKEAALSIANNWTTQFKNLPVYTEAGRKIVYTVEETNNDEYTATTEMTETEGQINFVVTNTLSASVNISGQKYWYDNADEYRDRPTAITLQILQDGIVFKTIQVEADWRFTVNGLPRYDENGVEHEYTIKEVPIARYTQTIEKPVETIDEAGNKNLSFKINNTYKKPDSKSISLEFWKSFVDETGTSLPIKKDDFEFEVTYTNYEGEKITQVVKNEASGEDKKAKVYFTREGISEPGSYTFTISEIKPSSVYIKPVNTNITATVVVDRLEDELVVGQPVYTRTQMTKDEKGADRVVTDNQNEFKNILETPEPVTIRPVLKKVLIGGDLAKKEFKFELIDAEGNPAETDVTAGADGTINFSELKFTEEGTYRYTIREIPGTDTDIKYDNREINLTVFVTPSDGTDLKLEAETVYTRDGEILTEAQPTITNIQYAEISEELSLYKKIKDGAKALKTEQFEFELYDEADLNTPIATAKNDANGKVTFAGIDALKYNYADADKTFTYIIKEKAGNLAGYGYSNEEITAKVTVTAGADNKLHTTVIYEQDGAETNNPAITNTYTKPSPTEVLLEAEKSLRATSGSTPTLAAGAYSFEVKDADDKVIAEAKNAADGKITFPQIAISDAGTYTYTISEVIPENKETGITYSTDTYKVTVTAARKANENTLEITSVVYEKADGTTVDKPAFVNTYTPPTGTQTGVAITKTLTGKALSANQFSFVLKNTSAPEGVTLAEDKTVKNDADGKVDFGQIGYDKEGTYEYTITEVNDGKAGYTYSDKTVNVTAVVTKEANNKLKAAVSYKIDGAATSSPTLANTYTKPDPTEAELGVKKEYVNADGGAAMAIAEGQFSFVLTAKNNAPMPEAAKGADTMTVKTSAAADGSTDVLFGSINYTELGTYTYTIAEEKGSNASISYDTAPITATVVIGLDETTNTYTKTITYSREGEEPTGNLLTVTNKYTKPTPGAVHIVANKTYKNAKDGTTVAIGSDRFHLTLTAVGTAPMPAGAANGKLTLAVPAGSGMQSVDFGSISYSEAGEYAYTITEETVNDESVVIDRKTVNVTVTVAQNGTEMEATVSYDGEPTAPTFANLYKQPVTGTLQSSKKFTGEGAPTTFLAGQYVFSISGNNWNGTANNDASGKVTFNLPEFTKAGDYIYEIKEVGFREGMEDPSITVNKDAVITATVTVSESADHVLSVSSIKYELNGEETSDPAITNTYTKPSPTEVLLEAEKSLRATSGSTPTLAAGAYSFEVKDADDKVIAEAKNAADGKITFPQIAISDAGTYTYTISEVIPENKETGITYSTDTYKVTVTAARKANENTLEITSVVYEKADGTTVDKPAFVNTYTPPTGTQTGVAITKTLTGKALSANQFSFVLKNTSAPEGVTLAEDKTVKNDADGKVDFGQIGYDKEGTYEYTITEVNDGKAGYTYSDKTVNVTAVVTKEANNKLKAAVSYKIDGAATSSPTLANTYTKPDPTEAELGVKKEYVNADGGAAMAIAEGQFSFVLTAKNNAPMPEAAKGADTMTVKTSAAADGSTDVLFGSINYTELGTYTYTIAEEKGSNASISYDTAPITATVVIGLDETTNTYTKTITYSRGSERKDDGLLTVKNTYKLPSATSLTPKVTKRLLDYTKEGDPKDRNFGNDVFAFNLYKSDANGTKGVLVETKTTTKQTVSEETIRFSTLSYTKDREVTEYYLIKEEAGTNPSITYDTEGILVKVEVKKAGNTLQATASYTKAGESDDKAKVITNEYRLPQEVNVTPQVTKKLENADGTPRNFGDDVFTFELYAAEDENGTLAEGAAPLDTLKTTKADVAQQLLKFKSRTYAKDIEPGDKVTKYYVIKEAQGDNISINYDTTAIVYKVVFEKDATDNKLKATETYTIGGKQTDDPTITNTYKTPTPAETALTVEKYFYDKTAQADKKFGSEVFTFELFKAEDGNGTLAEGATAIDTKQASGADISRQTLTFLTLRHEQDMKPGDSVTEYYLIREKAPTNPSIKCENPEVIAKVVYSKAKAAGAYSDAANKIDVSVSYKMKGETAFAEGRKTVKNLYTKPDAVVPQAPIQVKKAFFDITGGEGAKTPKAIHAGEFSFTITPVGEAPMTGITQTVSTKDAANGTDTISFGNTTYTKEGVYRYLITENAGTNPSVAYDKHVIEVIVTVTKNSGNKLVAATEYFVKENAEDAGTKEENPTFENLYTEPTATNFVPEVSKHLVDVTEGTEADRAFGNDIFTFNLYKAKADGSIEGAVLDTVSTSAEDKALAVKKLTFQEIELADDLAYDTAKTDFYYVIKEVKGDNPSITYDETAILVHAEVTKNADNKLEVKVTYSRGEENSGDGLEVKNIYTKPQPAKYVIEFTKKYFDITSGTETAKNFGSEIFNFSLYESNENGEQIGDPIEEISTTGSRISSQDLAFAERVYDQDIEPGQTVTQYYLIKEKKGANYSIGYDTKGILVKVTLTKDKQDADHPNAKNEVIASVEYLKQTSDGFTGTWSGDKQVVRNTYTTPAPVVPESPIQVKKAFFDITGGDEAKTAKAIHAGEFSFTITPVDDAPMTGISQTVSTKDAASGIDTISFGSTTYTKEGVYRYLITETSGKNPSVTYDQRVIEVVVTVTKTSANKLAAKTEYFVKGNAEAAGTMTTNPTFENLYKAPTATNFVPEVIKHLVDVTSGTEIDRVFGKDSFTFKLYEADAAGTIKGEASDTVSTGEEDKELALKKLAFKQIDISKDLEYGTDKTEYFYIIREEAGANPSIQDDVREILVKVTVTKTTDNKLAAKIEYIRGEEQKDTALTVTNRYTKPEPASFTPEATKKLTGRTLKDGDFAFELLDAEGNVIDTAANAEDGTIRFKELRFTEDADAKDYVYSIREVKGSMAGIIYDKSVFTMTVHVIKTAENKLAVESVTYLKDGAAADGIEFVNRRVSHSTNVSIEIKAEKRFEGGTLNGDDFSFKLEPMRDTKGSVRTASNRADGSINFGTFTYFDAGVYEYLITETQGTDKNILYDAAQIKVTVTVTKELGRLVANVKYEKSGTETNQFINKLKEPDKATVQIRTKKVLKGRELNSGDFRFILTPLSGAPGEVQTASNDADGNISFNTIHFDKEGIYRYEITEMRSSSMKDILYDKEKITVTVTVSKDEDGNLTAKVCYSKDGKADNRFINKTRESDGKPPQRDRDKDKDNSSIPKTGDENAVWLWVLLAGVSGGAFVGVRIARRKEEE